MEDTRKASIRGDLWAESWRLEVCQLTQVASEGMCKGPEACLADGHILGPARSPVWLEQGDRQRNSKRRRRTGTLDFIHAASYWKRLGRECHAQVSFFPARLLGWQHEHRIRAGRALGDHRCDPVRDEEQQTPSYVWEQTSLCFIQAHPQTCRLVWLRHPTLVRVSPSAKGDPVISGGAFTSCILEPRSLGGG